MSHSQVQRNYIDIADLAARTGLSISTINRLKSRGKIPYYQPGGKRARVLFPLDAIEAIASSAVPQVALPSAIAASEAKAGQAMASEDAPRSSSETRLSGPSPRWQKYET